MKLRIRGDTLRLRLTKTEVETLHRDRRIFETTHFPLQNQFRYGIIADAGAATYNATFSDQTIAVTVPGALITKWSQTEQVGLEHQLPLASGHLRILIEKDFACLKPRDDEDDSDAFANPDMK